MGRHHATSEERYAEQATDHGRGETDSARRSFGARVLDFAMDVAARIGDRMEFGTVRGLGHVMMQSGVHDVAQRRFMDEQAAAARAYYDGGGY